MLSQDVRLYQDCQSFVTDGNVLVLICDCGYRHAFHFPHAIPFHQPKVFSLSVQQLFGR